MQFLLVGLLISAALTYWQARNNRYTIRLGPTVLQRIADSYARQWGQRLTPDELQRLTIRYIRDEIFYREGRALGLDRDDEIVRRRIVQKFEFLQTSLAAADDPSPEVVEQWYEKHRARYLRPERVRFTQVYFSPDQEGDSAARSRAAEALGRLRDAPAVPAAGWGDPFPGPSEGAALSPDEADRLFGRSEMTAELFKTPIGHWSGPYRSGYGWHLLFVSAKDSPRLPDLAQVRDRVLEDYKEEVRQKMDEEVIKRLESKYRIIYEDARPD